MAVPASQQLDLPQLLSQDCRVQIRTRSVGIAQEYEVGSLHAVKQIQILFRGPTERPSLSWSPSSDPWLLGQPLPLTESISAGGQGLADSSRAPGMAACKPRPFSLRPDRTL